MNWTQLLFSFRGRAGRGKYWLVGVLVIAIWIAFFIFGLVMLGNNVDDLLSFAGAGLFLWLAGAILVIVTTWCGTAVGVKRLHDRDKSGWWILLFYFAPSILSSAQMGSSGGAAMLVGLAGFVISIWGLIELGFLRGTSGANRYGPDPLGGLSNEPLR